MHELPGQAARPAPPATSLELVRAVRYQASLGVSTRQARAARAQVSEQPSDRLAGVAARASLLHV
jgi:hypothetical protein